MHDGLDDNQAIPQLSSYLATIGRGVGKRLKSIREMLVVLLEDASYIVIYKPAGWIISGTDVGTMQGIVPPKSSAGMGFRDFGDLERFSSSSGGALYLHWFTQLVLCDLDVVFNLEANHGFCSRLDYGTAGLIFIGKSAELRKTYQVAAKSRNVTKNYMAFVDAEVPVATTITMYSRIPLGYSCTKSGGLIPKNRFILYRGFPLWVGSTGEGCESGVDGGLRFILGACGVGFFFNIVFHSMLDSKQGLGFNLCTMLKNTLKSRPYFSTVRLGSLDFTQTYTYIEY